ncbi:type I secretion C-terminal target domain-containing protein, partial [Rhodoferax sp.]|uniref:type I secretion C-terminal target domain-containing protein n=1 Tax=Rhodoferax sp. TaxID=50421 RepID=UPI00284F8382
GGAYAADVPNALPDGTYSVTATVKDPAGNSAQATDNNGGAGNVVDTTPPAITVPTTTQLINEDSSLVLASGNALTVADNSGGNLTTTLSVGHGSLLLGGTLSDVTVSVSTDGHSLTLSGTAAGINAALSSLTYTPTSDYSGSDALAMSTTDAAGNTSNSNVSITVAPVADVPSVSLELGLSSATSSTVTIDYTNATATGNGYTVKAYNLDGTLGTISTVSNSAYSGFGSAQASSGDPAEIGYSGGKSEKVTIDFATGASSATIQLSWLSTSEKATYTLYDANGNQIGQGTVTGVTDKIDPAFTVVADNGATISQIVFSAPGTECDYLIHSVTYVSGIVVPLTITATPNDTDHSETVTALTVTIPVGASLSNGVHNADGTWTLSLASNSSYTVTTDPVTHAVTVTGLTMTVPANYDGPVSAVATATVLDTATLTDGTTLTSTATASSGELMNGGTHMFSTSWESAPNGSTTSDPVTSTTLEGWTYVTSTAPGAAIQSGGTNGFEIWTTGDNMSNAAGTLKTVYAAPGDGSNWLELNDAGVSGGQSMAQTLGVSRTVTTQAGMVYQLSLDYAGRLGYSANYTKIAILVDGVVVATYAKDSTSNQNALDWQNLKLTLQGDGSNHTISILTDPSATDTAGRGAMIDDISLVAYQGVTAGNADGGNATDIALGNYVASALLHHSAGEVVSLTLGGLPSDAHIIVGANTYSVTNGVVVISGDDLSSATLRIDGSFVGDLDFSVTATTTESNGTVAHTVVEPIDLLVLPHAGTVVASDIVDSTGNLVNGTTGNDTLSANVASDLYGQAGDDHITGSTGSDVILGGHGNDTMTGNGGSDTFKWVLGDQGTDAHPAIDTITDFDKTANGDKLDLRDLLQGEVHTGTNAGNLADYLHFTYDSTTHATTVEVKSHGMSQAGPDQVIVLSNIDLVGSSNDAAIIQNLLQNGKLLTD